MVREGIRMRPLAVELLLGQIHRPATAAAGRAMSDSSLLRLAVRFAPLALVGRACHGSGLLRRLGGEERNVWLLVGAAAS